jgi:Fe-S-cluster-containing hydrogenase component 2
MRAHYGYKDGSGEFFITVETDACVDCVGMPCVKVCPAGVLEPFEDDYDDLVVAVKDELRHRLKYACAPCKPVSDRPPLPCVEVCPARTIEHSW